MMASGKIGKSKSAAAALILYLPKVCGIVRRLYVFHLDINKVLIANRY
jgi:hypothetical protein